MENVNAACGATPDVPTDSWGWAPCDLPKGHRGSHINAPCYEWRNIGSTVIASTTPGGLIEHLADVVDIESASALLNVLGEIIHTGAASDVERAALLEPAYAALLAMHAIATRTVVDVREPLHGPVAARVGEALRAAMRGDV